MIKLVAIDLDGTLLNENREVTETTKQVITEAKKAGVKIVLCTGRPLLGMIHLLEELKLNEAGDYVITYNGGLVQRADNGEILHQQTLDKAQLVEIYDLSHAVNVPMHFIDLKQVYSPAEPEGIHSFYPEIMKALPFVQMEATEAPADIAVNKILFCCEAEILDQAITKIPVNIKESYTMMKSRPNLLEILHPKVNKGNGIAALAQLLDIKPEEVMAIGDEENDLDMIHYAGLGVAMGNATDEVKAAAQAITASNREDGVVKAIEKYVLLK